MRLGREQGLNQHIIRHIELQTLQSDRNCHYEELTECSAKPAETKLLGVIKKYKGYLTTNRAFFSRGAFYLNQSWLLYVALNQNL